MTTFTRWDHFLAFLGIVRRIEDTTSGLHVRLAQTIRRVEGGICDYCRKQCIENCGGTCYCNVYTGRCLCE